MATPSEQLRAPAQRVAGAIPPAVTAARGACALLAVILAAGCGGGGDGSGSGAVATTAPVSESIDERFDVGGRKLYLSCSGTGSPTIVHLHGLGAASDGGVLLDDAFAGPQRFCYYDRADMGQSDPAPRRRTARESARDLHALLAAAELPPPYVLVGASWGGIVAGMYAAAHPDAVAGLVLLDASLPAQTDAFRLLPPAERKTLIDRREANPERMRVEASLREARTAFAQIPDVPVTYLAARTIELPLSARAGEIRRLLRRQQRAFVGRFSRGRLLIVDSPHAMEPAIPDVIVREIRMVVAHSRR